MTTNAHTSIPPPKAGDFPPLHQRSGIGPYQRQEPPPQVSLYLYSDLYSLQNLFAQMHQTAQALQALLGPREHRREGR